MMNYCNSSSVSGHAPLTWAVPELQGSQMQHAQQLTSWPAAYNTPAQEWNTHVYTTHPSAATHTWPSQQADVRAGQSLLNPLRGHQHTLQTLQAPAQLAPIHHGSRKQPSSHQPRTGAACTVCATSTCMSVARELYVPGRLVAHGLPCINTEPVPFFVAGLLGLYGIPCSGVEVAAGGCMLPGCAVHPGAGLLCARIQLASPADSDRACTLLQSLRMPKPALTPQAASSMVTNRDGNKRSSRWSQPPAPIFSNCPSEAIGAHHTDNVAAAKRQKVVRAPTKLVAMGTQPAKPAPYTLTGAPGSAATKGVQREEHGNHSSAAPGAREAIVHHSSATATRPPIFARVPTSQRVSEKSGGAPAPKCLVALRGRPPMPPSSNTQLTCSKSPPPSVCATQSPRGEDVGGSDEPHTMSPASGLKEEQPQRQVAELDSEEESLRKNTPAGGYDTHTPQTDTDTLSLNSSPISGLGAAQEADAQDELDACNESEGHGCEKEGGAPASVVVTVAGSESDCGGAEADAEDKPTTDNLL